MFSGTQNPPGDLREHLEESSPPADGRATDTWVRSRGGRPRLPGEERRTHRVGVSLNEAESEAIARKAEAAGLSPAVYLRQAGLDVRLSARVNGHTYHQLSRIGVNVNQMARTANRAGRLPELEVLYAILAEVIEIRERM